MENNLYIKCYNTNYYIKNREKILAHQKEYYKTHKVSYSKQKHKLKKYRSSIKGKFNSSKTKFKNIWKLSLEEYTKIINNNCHYCNKKLNIYGSGLDRKNPVGNYSINNVVPCCKNCNIMKNNFLTYEEMCVVGEALQKYWAQTSKFQPPKRC